MSVGQSKTIEDKYQAKVGRLQEADRFYVKEDGYLAFVDYEFSGIELKNYLISQFTVRPVALLGDSYVQTKFSYAYGYHMVSVPTGASKMTMKLPTPSAGMYLCLDLANAAGDAKMSLVFSDGALIVNATGSDMSCYQLVASARMAFICLADGTWSVVESNKALPQPSS